MTPDLTNAVHLAGHELTTSVMEDLRRAGETADRLHDPKALLYGGLHGALLRQDDGLDRLLVAGVVQVAGIRPRAIEEVTEELLDCGPLGQALAKELATALHDATEDVRQAREELDEL